MSKGFPRYDLLTEPLRRLSAHGLLEMLEPMTYANDLLQFLVRGCPYDLYRNISVTVPPLPHVRETALTKRNTLSVITKRDLERFRKDRVAAARPV